MIGSVVAGGIEPALVGGYRLLKPPPRLMLLALQKMLHHGQVDDFVDGGGRGLGAGRHGITRRGDRLSMADHW
jgi:hypothetical protein